MKDLNSATNNELEKMLGMAIGRAFRMASKSDEKLAFKAKNDAILIKKEIDSRS